MRREPRATPITDAIVLTLLGGGLVVAVLAIIKGLLK